ncbi:DUF4145 domain-containing protein [Pseudomonas sp. EKM23D]|uniref:DUF4145 domain-containing protein n=1 Tax=Pseudomonas sp. EKM23D TaxID=2708062 RepID=UPI00142D9D09|nr:DUF4145 domain-containing protein [Pseudomonas sp. EKM23D]KAF6687141.1 DUF4145 domain-containing protein [Pseudomonas sp. EKM23D]
MHWHNPQQIRTRSFICGHCAHKVGSSAGYFSGANQLIYICPHCGNPNYWGNGMGQIPGVAPGRPVTHVPKDINGLYEEARRCAGSGSFTGSVLLCRKLLMNIGVQEGAQEGKSFVYYIEFLAEKGFIPPNGRTWVDQIRQKGNEATHEIALMTSADASELVTFTEMLLKFIYEFPGAMAQPGTD